MNDAFLQGFIKRAQEQGIPENSAYELAKQAGFFSNVGNFANDMFVKPATGIFRDGGRALSAFGEGRFGDGFKATGSALGNAALTGLNFIPAGGLGSMAIRGGLRLGANALGRAGGAAMARGAAGSMLGRGGQALANGAGRLTGANTAFQGFQQAAGARVMQGANALGNKMMGYGNNIANQFRTGAGMPIVPFQAGAPATRGLNAVSNMGQRPLKMVKDTQGFPEWATRASRGQQFLGAIPASAGMMGYANNSGQRQQQQMIDDSEADFEYI